MPPSDKVRKTVRTTPPQLVEERNVPTAQMVNVTLGDVLQLSHTTLNDVQTLEYRVSRMLQQLCHNLGSDGSVAGEETRKTNGTLWDTFDNQQETQYALQRLSNDIDTLFDILSISR